MNGQYSVDNVILWDLKEKPNFIAAIIHNFILTMQLMSMCNMKAVA